MKYNKINNITGWITGAIAYIVYLKTMEPTASFWDCGEFLACASKLEVGHSPGAPFFMMLQRLFGIVAPAPDKMAICINSLSALTSALTILFLFWTITHFAFKLLVKRGDEPDSNSTLLIMGAGMVGALAYTFSDTFWFSAVEAEVYGTSSFFTAITFWAILKWERVADSKYADRWLVLIAYLIGVSLGVHLLNLLCIPPIIMLWYYRRYTATTRGAIIAFLAGCGILGFVQVGIIQYIPKIAANFDILFTNSFNLPFDAGSVTFLVLLTAGLIGLLLWVRKKGYHLLHTSVLCIMFIIIGYSSYIVPVIRSRADVPIDMTNPDNAFSLNSYVSREQFGSQPLLYGPDFTSPVVNIKTTGSIYTQMKKNGKDYYEETGKKREPEYDPTTLRFFPRIWEGNEGHPQFYRSYLNIADGATPTGADNMQYFIRYQMDWLWWRYFMWNFAGRQNDLEGQGEPKNGNWISGIKPLDNWRVGDIDKMGDGYRNNGARNQLYFLPLILGLLGAYFHYQRNRKDWIATLIFFFFTGAAIGIFLNMAPVQPRERDYAFAGCTYVFAIWIGLGVLMLSELLKRFIKGPAGSYATIGLCLLAVPTLMAKEEWDDHDRSKKTIARDTAYNALMSCAPNAILLTFGDNDTYPLWYLQEVEGVRPDVRIMINTLIGTEWFIDQLNNKVNNADAIPMVWSKEDYAGSRHEYVRYYKDPRISEETYINLYDMCRFIISKDDKNMLQNQMGEKENYFPSHNVYVQGLSKEELVKNGMVNAADTANIENDMKFHIDKGGLYKNDVTLINMIAANAKDGWKRPIYFSGGFPGNENYMGLGNYLRQEGMVYRLVPYSLKTPPNTDPKQQMSNIDLDKSYNLFMNTFRWGGGDKNNVYFDEKNRVMFIAYRLYASQIADQLTAHGRSADAIKLLDRVMTGISEHAYFYDAYAYYMAISYYRAGAKDKGRDLALKLARNAEDDVAWVMTLSDDQKETTSRDVRNDLTFVNSLASTAETSGDQETAKKLKDKFQSMLSKVGNLVRQ